MSILRRKLGAGPDFVVGKMECMWHALPDTRDRTDGWHWQILIRVPDAIGDDDLQGTIDALIEKKKPVSVRTVKRVTLHEGTCVQMLHVGPYENEPETFALMQAFAREAGFTPAGPPHEIYLSDPRRVESAKLDLSYCDVKAPVSGLIGAKLVSVGSLVGKGEPTLLATISTLDPIWFYCAISEVDYLRAQRIAGRKLGETRPELILADGSEFPEPGKWVFLDRAVDVSTGTIRARAEFPNAGKVLRPGMFARVRVSLKTEKDSILIPQRAVLELQGRNFVWLVGEGNRASQRAIKAGVQIGSDWLITEGLKTGDRLIVEGVQKVRNDAEVQPLTAAEMARNTAAAAGPAKEKE